MGFIQKIKNAIKQYIIRRASQHKAIDIVEVRTKQIGLLKVLTETDLLIKNTFFLPYTLLSIQTDLLNKDGLKVGKMTYSQPTKVKGNSELVFTTSSEISIITSLFQALSNLLSQPIWMRSVGIATVKVLWFTIELPVDDTFEIHPSKLKIVKDETEEEKALRLEKEAKWKAKYEAEKEKRKAERKEKRDEWKEDILKRRYKDKYIPKEQRQALKDETSAEKEVPFIITNETSGTMEIALDSASLSNPEQETIVTEEHKEEIISTETTTDGTADSI